MSPEDPSGLAAIAPPQDLEAERALLGAMIINPGAIAVACKHVASSDFYRPSHGTVFSVIVAMDRRGDSVDTVTLVAEFRREGLLAAVGGQDFIHALPDFCPVAVNVAQYAAIVGEMAQRRRGIELARRLERVFTEGSPAEQQREGRVLLRLLGIATAEGAGHDRKLTTG